MDARHPLIESLKEDHRNVISLLLILRKALRARNVPTARQILEELDRLAGPHIDFEEKHIVPAIRDEFGFRLEAIFDEHESMIAYIQDLKDLMQDDEIPASETRAAAEWLGDVFLHTANCDGLLLLAERLEVEFLDNLWEKKRKVGDDGPRLSELRQREPVMSLLR